MPVKLTPFNPLAWWLPTGKTTSTTPTTKPGAKTTPITITRDVSDPGLKVTAGKDSLTIRGTAKGDKMVNTPIGGGAFARGVHFTLDHEKAPTKDVFGRTDYTEANSRCFDLVTQKGWTAAECANRLAAKVNAGDDFTAKVTKHRDGSVTLQFKRR